MGRGTCFASVWEAESRLVSDNKDKILQIFTLLHWPSLTRTVRDHLGAHYTDVVH